jgi:hypothetical protein
MPRKQSHQFLSIQTGSESKKKYSEQIKALFGFFQKYRSKESISATKSKQTLTGKK